jgi:hypothetical protein
MFKGESTYTLGEKGGSLETEDIALLGGHLALLCDGGHGEREWCGV